MGGIHVGEILEKQKKPEQTTSQRLMRLLKVGNTWKNGTCV